METLISSLTCLCDVTKITHWVHKKTLPSALVITRHLADQPNDRPHDANSHTPKHTADVTALLSTWSCCPLPVKFRSSGCYHFYWPTASLPLPPPPDSLSVSPRCCPASQSKGRESKGATYQVDYQEVLLWLIRTECARKEGC